jgi:hypothetical protein
MTSICREAPPICLSGCLTSIGGDALRSLRLTPSFRLLGAVAAVCAIALMIRTALIWRSEYRAKVEWSGLQGIEMASRSTSQDEHLLIESHEGHPYAGVLSSDGQTRVWILLDSEYPPLLKEMPQRTYYLSAGELKALATAPGVRAEVIHELQSRLK